MEKAINDLLQRVKDSKASSVVPYVINDTKGQRYMIAPVSKLDIKPIFEYQAMYDALNKITDERRHQLIKFGDQKDLTNLESLAVVTEELGEVAQVLCKREVPPIKTDDLDRYSTTDLQVELTQLGTCVVAWLVRVLKYNKNL